MALFAPKLPLKRPFDPELIVSDAQALDLWRQDPLVSRGKVTAAYLSELLRAQAKLPGRFEGSRIPVLALWGTGDRVVSQDGHKMLVAASGHECSQLIRYEGGFHNLLAEPALKADVMADILSWMQRLAQRGV